MSAEVLLGRLNGIRSNGNRKWVARCPAHADKSPSLSVQEKDDGQVLVHCFAGCTFRDIVNAAGVNASDLFAPGSRRAVRVSDGRASAWDVLRAVAAEVRIVSIAAADIVAGRALSDADVKRITEASGRINVAWRYVNGRA